MIVRTSSLIAAFILFASMSPAALAQGFGEQAPLQFRYANQGLTNAVYARQLAPAGASSSGASSGAASGTNGSSQSSSQLSNVIQVYNNQTYNVNGSGNVLNVEGTTVNGQQTSSGTSQNNSNAKANEISVTQPKPLGSNYLN